MTVDLKRDIRAEENVRSIKLWGCKRGLQNECISLPAVTAQGPGRWIQQPGAELCCQAGWVPLLWLSLLIILLGHGVLMYDCTKVDLRLNNSLNPQEMAFLID